MEVEFKLHVPRGRLRAVQAEVRDGTFEQVELQARYFDTPDGDLGRARLVLRLRREGERWVQTAKGAGDDPMSRLEHNADLGPADEATAPPEPDLARHDGTRVGDALRALDGVSNATLQERFSTRITRLRRVQPHGKSRIEISLDIGEVRVPRRAAFPERLSAVCELELELIDGRTTDLVALARLWTERFQLAISTISKDQRGRRLRDEAREGHEGREGAEGPPPLAVKAAPVTFKASRPSGAQIQRAVVASCLDQILPNASEMLDGSEDADVIHQLRVGIRRLRTALRELDGLGPVPFDPAWQAPLQQIFTALGDSRDAELLRTRIQPRIEAAGGPAIDLPAPAAASTAAAGSRSKVKSKAASKPTAKATTRSKAAAPAPPLSKALFAPGFQSTLLDLLGFCMAKDEWADASPAQGDDAHADALRALRKRLRKLHRKVARDGARFDTLGAEAQHSVRKRLKRLRYLAEFVGPLFARKAVQRYLAALTPAQDVLGDFNDNHTALQRYTELAASEPRAWFQVGWLSAVQADGEQQCRRALKKVAKAPRFWKIA